MMIDHHMNIHRSLILQWKYIVDAIGDEVLQLVLSNSIFQSIPIGFEFESHTTSSCWRIFFTGTSQNG